MQNYKMRCHKMKKKKKTNRVRKQKSTTSLLRSSRSKIQTYTSITHPKLSFIFTVTLWKIIDLNKTLI